MKNYDNIVLVVAVAILSFVGGIAFVNNWLVLNKNYPEVGMFDIPFKSDVWGTVSDWATVLVTAFTAYYLVKTFRAQQIITQLDQKRFLDSHLPLLEVEAIKYENSDSASKTSFDVVINSNPLQNLEISHNFPESFEISIPHVIKNVMLAKGKVLKFNVTLILEPVFLEITQYSGNTITFKFEDSLGNKYNQHLFFLGSNNVHMQPAFRV